MTSKTQNKKELIHGLKTNCKKGYNLLAETQAELTATQKWIIEKLLPHRDGSYCPHNYYELTRFLTDLNISIKVPMLTVMTPYTNKKGKTTMKHYTANGFMVNDLKDDKPVLYPTWIKFNDRTLQTNEGGHFTSFTDQTVYTLAPARVVVELVVEEEEEEEEKEEVEYHFCGVTGGENDDIECCRKKVIAEDTCMIGNTSYCIECFEKHEENEEVEVEVEEEEVEVEVDIYEQQRLKREKHEQEQLASIAHIEILSTDTYRKVKHLTKAGAVAYCKANKIRGYANFHKKDLISYIIRRQEEELGNISPSYITEKIKRELLKQ